MMKIIFNGNPFEISEGISVADFLKSVGELPKLFVIELNEKILYKEDYETVRLHEGDEIELVTFTGGG